MERGRMRQDICEERQASRVDCAKLSVCGVRGLKMCSSRSTGGVGERIRPRPLIQVRDFLALLLV